MANTKQSKKRARQNITRRQRNLQTITYYKKAVKAVTKGVEDKSLTKDSNLVSIAYKALDIASKKRVISPQKAARKKSQIAKLFIEVTKQVQFKAV